MADMRSPRVNKNKRSKSREKQAAGYLDDFGDISDNEVVASEFYLRGLFCVTPYGAQVRHPQLFEA